jgi:N-acetylglucosaminylphosphatidylinositol deacetylase
MLLIGMILFVCVLLVVVPFILIGWIRSSSNEHTGNYLLVIAHPDDECLFFAPFLLSVRSRAYVLCLSNGRNHRADELRRSCQQLAVQDWNIIDDPINLKDAQSVCWSRQTIVGHVERAIRQWQISTVVSFDGYGVSGHQNHSSIYYALLDLSRSVRSLHFLSLRSVPIYRKYFSLVELLRFAIERSSPTIQTFVLPCHARFTPHKAMFAHRSQLVWFRYLYLLFSRYIWINDFQLIY